MQVKSSRNRRTSTTRRSVFASLRAVRACAGFAMLFIALLLPAGSAFAQQSAADFYRGKTVTILVGSPPGGGYDLYARLIAPYLAKKLDAQVIIENRAGGSGLLALNVLNSSSKVRVAAALVINSVVPVKLWRDCGISVAFVCEAQSARDDESRKRKKHVRVAQSFACAIQS